MIFLALLWASVGLTNGVLAGVSFLKPRWLRPFGLSTALLSLVALGFAIIVFVGSQVWGSAVVVSAPAVLGGALSAALPRRGVDRAS